MDTLRGLLARDRRSDYPALRAPRGPDHEYDYRRLLTNAWKTGNFLSHCGVRSGRTVGIAGRRPAAVLAFLGTASLGGVARFDPPASIDARAVVAPVGGIDAFELPPGGTHVAYGDPPDDPDVAHFERDVWSENPTEPPDEVAPDDPGLRTHSHARLLDAADGVGDRWGLDDGCAVALRAPLTHPGTVIAAVAALAVEGCVVLGDGSDADYAVATDDVPGTRVLSPDDVV